MEEVLVLMPKPAIAIRLSLGMDWENLVESFGTPGIFNPDDDRNPLKDFSLIFVPYCTGDVHSGTLLNGKALDVNTPQRYVGAINFKKAMDFIEPYFKFNEVDEIVLFGMSAGGYGVYINFLEVAKRFPGVKITVINDSGPLFSDADAFSSCLQVGFKVILDYHYQMIYLAAVAILGLGWQMYMNIQAKNTQMPISDS
ncbi:MAG: hypothetical protein IPF63_03635 [Bacteroidetes bacterium]|nr:hypothetical protein [Bacteroidota bacterium]